nr:MAG TPA: hypothetical protein [Caudoviricetes sp.]
MSKRGSGGLTRASGSFSKNEKAAISRFEDYAKQRYSVVGRVEYKKGEGERVEATFTTKDTFNRQRGGKMVHPDNYDVVERTSKRSFTIFVSSSGATKLHQNPSTSEEKVLSKHYYKPPKRKK